MSDITWSSEQNSSVSWAGSRKPQSLPHRPDRPPKRTIQEIYAEQQLEREGVEALAEEDLDERPLPTSLSPEEAELLAAIREGKLSLVAVNDDDEPAEPVDPIAAAAKAVAEAE